MCTQGRFLSPGGYPLRGFWSGVLGWAQCRNVSGNRRAVYRTLVVGHLDEVCSGSTTVRPGSLKLGMNSGDGGTKKNHGWHSQESEPLVALASLKWALRCWIFPLNA